MIKLFSLKEEKAKEASSGASSNPKIPPGLIRMQKGECRCRRLPLHARCGPRLHAGSDVGLLGPSLPRGHTAGSVPDLLRLPARRHE